MTRADELALLTWATQGNTDAVAFLLAITDAAHAWDDVVDADHALDRRALDGAFTALVLTLPSNGFYRTHRDRLDPIIQQAAINWQVATELEREPCGAHLHVAYILRSTYIDLVSHAALIVGGPAWALTVCRQVRLLNQDETFSDYLTSLATEASERAARVED